VATKFGLGKGLNALIPEFEDHPTEGSAEGETSGRQVALSLLKPNPNQPRKRFDETALGELAESIRTNGIIQPIVVEEDGTGSYLIIAGERRFRAASIAGLREVPVVVRRYSEKQKLEIALIENVQREDLNPLEEAEAYRSLMELTGANQEDVAARVGKNRSTVANALRLLKLPPSMLPSIENGSITPGHARAILSVLNPADQQILFDRAVAEGLSVREAERLAGDLNAGKRPKPATTAHREKSRDPELQAMEEKLISALGTKVSIEGGAKKGEIRISYFSLDDLNRVYEIISGGRAD
jgi:ParB family transcriptional regulator, chromosome partitioning protein